MPDFTAIMRLLCEEPSDNLALSWVEETIYISPSQHYYQQKIKK